MTKREFAGVVALLSGYYGERFKADDHFVLDVWYAELRDLEASDVAEGIRQMARESDAWPTIANVRRYAENDVSLEDIWTATYRAICYHGPYGKWDSELRQSEFPVFTADVTHAVERVGGARAVLDAPDAKALSFVRIGFIAALREIRLQSKREALHQSSHSILAAPVNQQGVSRIADVISDLRQKTDG